MQPSGRKPAGLRQARLGPLAVGDFPKMAIDRSVETRSRAWLDHVGGSGRTITGGRQNSPNVQAAEPNRRREFRQSKTERESGQPPGDPKKSAESRKNNLKHGFTAPFRTRTAKNRELSRFHFIRRLYRPWHAFITATRRRNPLGIPPPLTTVTVGFDLTVQN